MENILLLKTKTVPSDPYHDLLTENSISHHFIPLLTHKHIPEQCIEKLEIDYENIGYLIITSQRAVEALQQSILPKLSNKVVRYLLELPILTVGPATADFLQKLGFTNIKGGSEAGNGSILADIIISDKEINYKAERGLFLVGEIRKDVIPRKLKPLGFDITEIVVYTTKSMDCIMERYTDKLLSNRKNIVVFFSPQGTEEIVEHIDSCVKVLSIGPTTKQYLIEKNIKVDGVCEKPNAKSLLTLLKE